MKQNLTSLISVMLALLLVQVTSLVVAQPPALPMTVQGYVFIGNQTAPEGVLVWAKVGTEPISGANDTTDATGYYVVAVSGPADGTPIDMWVENYNVTRITMQSGTIVDLNLTIPALAPVVNFTATPRSGVEPLTVNFTDLSANFYNITSWFWDFGDGTNSTEQNPIHTYEQDGNYTVSLTVTGDNTTLTETKPDYIIVYDSEPAADFYGTPIFGAPPLTVQFYDLSTSYDGIISRLWDFGDNTTSTEKDPKHTYTAEGIYTVTLTVTEADGDTDTAVKVNYIIVTTKIAASVTVIIDTGSIHFPGETAEFYIMTLDSAGIPVDVNFTECRLWFNYDGNNYFVDLPKPTQIEGGVYRTYHEVPLDAPQTVYTLVITVKRITPEGTSYGGALRSFQISPTLTGWNAWIKEIKDNIATIAIPDLGIIKENLTAISAKLDNIQGKIATITSDIGLIKANVSSINATLVDINGKIATINSTVGTIQTDTSNINAKLKSLNDTIAIISTDVGEIKTNVTAIHLKVVDIDWETKIATIQTTLGTIKGYVENVDDGGLATINTNLGAVKTDISDIAQKGLPVDLTPVWIAVIFSILAFIASIVTAYLLRSKIA